MRFAFFMTLSQYCDNVFAISNNILLPSILDETTRMYLHYRKKCQSSVANLRQYSCIHFSDIC